MHLQILELMILVLWMLISMRKKILLETSSINRSLFKVVDEFIIGFHYRLFNSISSVYPHNMPVVTTKNVPGGEGTIPTEKD